MQVGGAGCAKRKSWSWCATSFFVIFLDENIYIYIIDHYNR